MRITDSLRLKIIPADRERLLHFFKYALVSFFSYGFVFLGLFVFIDLLKINKSVSFFIVYLLAYAMLYFVQLKYLFQQEHDHGKLVKFLLHIGFFFVCNNLLFNLLVWIGFHYILATVINIAILFPLRYLSSKLLVFTHEAK